MIPACVLGCLWQMAWRRQKILRPFLVPPVDNRKIQAPWIPSSSSCSSPHARLQKILSVFLQASSSLLADWESQNTYTIRIANLWGLAKKLHKASIHITWCKSTAEWKVVSGLVLSSLPDFCNNFLRSRKLLFAARILNLGHYDD